MIRSNSEWRAWGQRDPLWGVAALPDRAKDGARPWTEPEFYAHGARLWAEIAPQLRQYGVSLRHVVEIGSGAGRITRSLSEIASHVDAVDISEEMLAIAKRNVDPSRVTFHATDGATLPVEDTTATLVLSCDVFQHFGREVALDYLREAARVLEPGGVLAVQLPLYRFPVIRASGSRWLGYGLAGLYRLARKWEQWQADRARRRMARGGAPIMMMTRYEIGWLVQHLSASGFRDVEIRYFPQLVQDWTVPTLRSWVLARRGQPGPRPVVW